MTEINTNFDCDECQKKNVCKYRGSVSQFLDHIDNDHYSCVFNGSMECEEYKEED